MASAPVRSLPAPQASQTPRSAARSLAMAANCLRSLRPWSEVRQCWERGTELGGGAYGVVHRARRLEPVPGVSQSLVALKTMQGRDCLPAAAAEIAHLRMLSGHANIVELLDAYADEPTQRVLLVMRLGFCSLRQFELQVARVALPTTAKFAAGLLRGLQYLHERGICHRDVKPANALLFLDEEAALHLQLGDFGVSVSAGHGGTSVGRVVTTFEYAAPEEPTDSASVLVLLRTFVLSTTVGEITWFSSLSVSCWRCCATPFTAWHRTGGRPESYSTSSSLRTPQCQRQQGVCVTQSSALLVQGLGFRV